MALTFRSYREGQEKEIATFHERARGVPTGPEFWRWKYLENPAAKTSMYFAWDGDRIVGRVCELPVRLKVGEKEVLAGQGLDIDVLKEYRTGRTLLRLEQLTREVSKAHGTVVDFAFANAPTSKFFASTHVGFSLVAPVRRWSLILDPVRFLAKKLKLSADPRSIGGLLKELRTRRHRRKASQIAGLSPVKSFDDRFDRLWKEAYKWNVMVVRDSAYLNWRYVRCPSVKYSVFAVDRGDRIEGFIVLQVMSRNDALYGHVVDILVARGAESAIGDLLAAAVSYFGEQGVVVVVCWAPKHSLLAPFLKVEGFRMKPIASNLIGRTYRPEEVPLDSLAHEDDWYYTMGDSDYMMLPQP